MTKIDNLYETAEALQKYYPRYRRQYFEERYDGLWFDTSPEIVVRPGRGRYAVDFDFAYTVAPGETDRESTTYKEFTSAEAALREAFELALLPRKQLEEVFEEAFYGPGGKEAYELRMLEEEERRLKEEGYR